MVSHHSKTNAKTFNKSMAKELVIILGLAISVAFTVNLISPTGIAIVGQWDYTKGVVTAKAKNDVEFNDLELNDINMAKQIYDSQTAIFVDARSGDDYQDGHIRGAVSLPVNQFNALFDSFKGRYPTDSVIVTYCSGRNCDDSHRLAQLLLEQGYMEVLVFVDGYPGWAKEGYPIE